MDGHNDNGEAIDEMEMSSEGGSRADEETGGKGDARGDVLWQSLTDEKEVHVDMVAETVEEDREHPHILNKELNESKEDDIQNELEAYILERTKDGHVSLSDDPSIASDPESESSIDISDEEKHDEFSDQPRRMKILSAEELDIKRQRALRDVAVHDRVGGDYHPQLRTPTELIAKLQKRKEEAIRYAKEMRAPFEKFQDFDAFIDEVTVTDDQSWKTLQINTKHTS